MHNLWILNCHLQIFHDNPAIIPSLWYERWDKYLGNKWYTMIPQFDEKYFMLDWADGHHMLDKIVSGKPGISVGLSIAAAPETTPCAPNRV